MIRKLKQWWHRHRNQPSVIKNTQKMYTYEQVKKAMDIAFTDGKRVGLEIAKQQAAKSLGEILRQQNK